MPEADIHDLVPSTDGAAKAAEVADEAGSGGQWVVDLVEKLDEKGMLDTLMFGADGGVSGAQPQAAPAPPEAPEPGETQSSSTLDVATVKSMLLEVYDNSSRIPGLSDDPTVTELVKLLDKHPKQAEKMLGEL